MRLQTVDRDKLNFSYKWTDFGANFCAAFTSNSFAHAPSSYGLSFLAINSETS